jgi:hypothetical protein
MLKLEKRDTRVSEKMNPPTPVQLMFLTRQWHVHDAVQRFNVHFAVRVSVDLFEFLSAILRPDGNDHTTAGGQLIDQL